MPTSALTAGLYQQVPGLERGKDSAFYRQARAGYENGFGPTKLAALADRTLPDVGYYSDTDTTPERLEALSRGGYVPNITMAWGKDYPGIISHMVTNAYYRANGWACIIDSNDPGRYHWIPATECDARRSYGGFRWTWAWAKSTLTASPTVLVLCAVGTLGLLFLAFTFLAGCSFAYMRLSP